MVFIRGIVLLPVGILIVGQTDSFKLKKFKSSLKPSSFSSITLKVLPTPQTSVSLVSSSESSSSIICGDESSSVVLIEVVLLLAFELEL